MNRKMHVLVWTVGVCVLGIMVLNSCITVVPTPEPAPEPTPTPAPAPTPTPEPTPAESDCKPLEEMLDNFGDQITILEWPTEARIGEYMTVKIKVGSDKFWDCVQQQVRENDAYDNAMGSLLLDPSYSLYLYTVPKGFMPAVVFGCAEPDDNHEISWYGPIHASVGGLLIEPGTWKLIVGFGCESSAGPEGIVERNITIKE